MDTGLCDLKENEAGLPDIQGSDQEDLEEVRYLTAGSGCIFILNLARFFARQNNTENM